MNYKKIYCNYFGYCETDFIPSELSGVPSSDIHHIVYKSQGGKDVIENLIALSRDEHARAHFLKKPYLKKDELLEKHKQFMGIHAK